MANDLESNHEETKFVPSKPDKDLPRDGQYARLYIEHTNTRLYLAIAIVVSTVISMCMLGALLSKCNTQPPDDQITASFSGAQSCLDLIGEGITKDGFYEVKPHDELAPTETYCDMTTDGGGWTLVASIHENDIQRKCYPDDLWSVYQHLPVSEKSKSNWENEMTFGDVRRSTKADFKHAGFFAMNASDVMVWHVPNEVTTASWKDRLKLSYRTNNKFLQSNGGSIGAIYKDKFPLNVSEQESTAMVLDALTSKGTAITKILSKYYNYEYNQSSCYPTNAIPDNFMYRPSYFGNRVSFKCSNAPGCSFPVVPYGVNYRCPKLATFGTRKSKPFFAAAIISNDYQKATFSYIKVESERPYRQADDEAVFRNMSITKENFKLQYELVQYKYLTYVTIGEFYFVVSSVKEWSSSSVEHPRLHRSSKTNAGYTKQSQYQIEGRLRNVILGYTLLPISSGSAITKDQADKVGEEILDAIAPLKNLFSGSGLSTPVVFDEGTKKDVMTMVPPTMRPFAQPGFLQFRAYNLSGYPTAFCPGIRVFSIHPEYACVGSISNSLGDHGTCGDFAGWEGEKNDVSQSHDAVGLAHSRTDTMDTIFIFQR